jgi:NAD(P)-dependent dehydrogenase (short-subunit alcohol dehydrogenase family)
MDSADRLALVTGAASGIGRATALAFARAGAQVALVDIDARGAGEVVREIEAGGGHASAFRADLSRVEEIRGVFRQVLERYGQIDALANVAAIFPTADVLDVSEAHWDRVLDLDLRGAFFCCQEAVRHMLGRGSGAIVNVASGAAFRPIPGFLAYSAAKAGLVGMTRVIALEVARRGVRINVVSPGHTETEGVIAANPPERRDALARQLAGGRWLAPGEIAAAIVYLCSDAASGVNGAVLHVNGGNWMP